MGSKCGGGPVRLLDVDTWKMAGFQNQLIRRFMLVADVVGGGIQELFTTNSRISRPPPTLNGVSTGFEIPPIPRYQHPITSPDLPHPYFPFFPPVAPANTGVSLPLHLMKATVLVESYTFYPLSSRSADSSNVY